MILVLAAAVVAAIALPHVLRLERVAPLTAGALWGAALGLRAVTGVFAAIYLIFYLPATDLFTALTHWCWHTILPVAATHLGVNGHRVGDAVTVLPSVLLAASVVWIVVGVYRAARSVSGLIRRGRLGDGPGDSVIIGGPDVVLAAAGISRPRIVVSAGALLALDDAELAAGIAHERGHIARRHRFVSLYAELCRALGRFLPGTHIPIMHPDMLEQDRPDYILILPWNLRQEIVAQLEFARDWGAKFIVPIPRVEEL